MPKNVKLRRAALGAIGAAFLCGAPLRAETDKAAYTQWGKDLFMTHCAACHGDDGRGAGPAAAALKTGLSDLTLMSKTHDGTFPRLGVIAFIDGEKPIAAHGSREMPVWGPFFREREGKDVAARAVIYSLTDYLETIQQR